MGTKPKKMTYHDDYLIFFCRKRNVTKCYWETQPQGCAKPHCPFLHQYPKVNIFKIRSYSSLYKSLTKRIQSRRRFPSDTMLLVLRPQIVRWTNLSNLCLHVRRTYSSRHSCSGYTCSIESSEAARLWFNHCQSGETKQVIETSPACLYADHNYFVGWLNSCLCQ